MTPNDHPVRCLHLVASAGNPADTGADYTRLDGGFRRFPLGVRKIGRVATAGEPLLLPDVRGDEEWIADPEWTRREAVRTFAAQPLVFRGEVLGVLAIFDRQSLGKDDFDWLRVFADHAAVSIANARAFEEIEFLKARLEEENTYLRQEVTAALGVGDFVGESPGLGKVMRQNRLVAPTDAAVLVTGESGTGKELVARAIHDHGQRKGRALIKVNCGAVPDALFESEFFGHAKGAFTGAIRDKPGRFELADGGTLFLDEIGEVPPALQAKLLRVLQEGKVERVGETRTRKVDVRIIAATNRDLAKEVAAGRFRQDLYYRLSVLFDARRAQEARTGEHRGGAGEERRAGVRTGRRRGTAGDEADDAGVADQGVGDRGGGVPGEVMARSADGDARAARVGSAVSRRRPLCSAACV